MVAVKKTLLRPGKRAKRLRESDKKMQLSDGFMTANLKIVV